MSTMDYLRHLCEQSMGRIAAAISPLLGVNCNMNWLSSAAWDLPTFLIVVDIVRFSRENGIRCQGRGSAANSLVRICSTFHPLIHCIMIWF